MIVVDIAEEPRAKVHIIENKPAEIGIEKLIARAESKEVVVIRQIAKVHFGEVLLDRVKILRAGGMLVPSVTVGRRIETRSEHATDISRIGDATRIGRRRIGTSID